MRGVQASKAADLSRLEVRRAFYFQISTLFLDPSSGKHDLFLDRLLSRPIAGFYGSSDAGQHALGRLGVGACGLQFEIFLKRFCRARRSDYLVVLVHGFLGYQVYTLPIVGVRAVGISRNHFVEGRDCVVGFTRVGEHGAFIEVVLCRSARIGLGCLLIGFNCVVGLAGLGIGLCQVVVIGRKFFRCVGILVICNGLLQLHSLLISGNGRVQPLLLFRQIGLLVGRQTVGISQLEPDQVPAGIHLVGLVQGVDGSVIISALQRGSGS